MIWQPGSTRLAIGCADGRIRVIRRGQQASSNKSWSVIAAPFFPLVTLPMAPRSLSCGKDAATRLWDTRTGETLVILPGISSTGDVQFSSDGTRAALPTHDSLGVIAEIIRPAVVREVAAARPDNMRQPGWRTRLHA